MQDTYKKIKPTASNISNWYKNVERHIIYFMQTDNDIIIQHQDDGSHLNWQ